MRSTPAPDRVPEDPWPRPSCTSSDRALLDALKGYDRRRFLADVSAGITVGVVALPLATAFAIASESSQSRA